MGSFIFIDQLRRFQSGENPTAGATLKAILCRGGNNVVAMKAANFVADITLDEYAGFNYARPTLTGVSLLEVPAEDRSEFHCDNIVYPALGPDILPATGFLTYIHLGADAINLPLCWIDKAGFPRNGDGQDFTLKINPAGLFYVETVFSS